MNKPQATMKDDAPKKPVSQKIGRGATKATMGTLFGVGRFAAKASTGFLAGVVEAGREIKSGYDEGKAEASD